MVFDAVHVLGPDEAWRHLLAKGAVRPLLPVSSLVDLRRASRMPASGQVPPHAWAIPIEVQAVPETRFLCTSVLGMRVPVCSVRSRASRAELSHRALNSWAFRLDVEPRFQVCNRTN